MCDPDNNEQQNDAAAPISPEIQKPLQRPRVLFNTDIPMRKYVIRVGLISLIPSLIISFTLASAGIMNEETVPQFEGPVLFLIVGIIFICPVLETLLMSLIFWILSFFTKRTLNLAVTSAIIWAVLHSLAAPAWGLGVLWPFFVFSCSYLAWREKAWWRAIWVTSCVHMFQNFLPGLMIAFAL